MPKRFLTENGPRKDFAALYGAREPESAEYSERTRRNMIDSDGMLLFGSLHTSGAVHDRMGLQSREAPTHGVNRRGSWVFSFGGFHDGRFPDSRVFDAIMGKPDYDDPDVEERWCEAQRALSRITFAPRSSSTVASAIGRHVTLLHSRRSGPLRTRLDLSGFVGGSSASIFRQITSRLQTSDRRSMRLRLCASPRNDG
jgi:Circularly permutated YpsA SLOG family